MMNIRATLWLICLVAAHPACAQAVPVENEGCVVVLHGLARTSLSMKWIEWELEDHGYVVVNPT
ncbi:MAG: alpha/beta hydrolase, partial [Anaerolineae bacterium]